MNIVAIILVMLTCTAPINAMEQAYEPCCSASLSSSTQALREKGPTRFTTKIDDILNNTHAIDMKEVLWFKKSNSTYTFRIEQVIKYIDFKKKYQRCMHSREVSIQEALAILNRVYGLCGTRADVVMLQNGIDLLIEFELRAALIRNKGKTNLLYSWDKTE